MNHNKSTQFPWHTGLWVFWKKKICGCKYLAWSHLIPQPSAWACYSELLSPVFLPFTLIHSPLPLSTYITPLHPYFSTLPLPSPLSSIPQSFSYGLPLWVLVSYLAPTEGEKTSPLSRQSALCMSDSRTWSS